MGRSMPGKFIREITESFSSGQFEGLSHPPQMFSSCGQLSRKFEILSRVFLLVAAYVDVPIDFQSLSSWIEYIDGESKLEANRRMHLEIHILGKDRLKIAAVAARYG